MRKFLVLMVCLVMCAYALVGCGSNSSSETQSTPADQTPQNASTNKEDAKTDQPEKQVLLKYYTWELNDKTKAQIEDFEQKNPNIKVEPLVLVQGDGRETLNKLDLLYSAGEQVDVIRFANVDTVVQRAEHMLEPLNGYFEAEGVKPEDEYYVNVKYKDNYYTTMDTVSEWFVGINQELLDKAQLSVPEMGWTWDDFREYAKKLKSAETYGAYFHTWGEYANPIVYSERKNPYIYEDLSPRFDDPSFAYFFNLRRAMEKDDQSVKPLSDVIGGKLSFDTEFFSQSAAMIMYNTRLIDLIADQNKYPHTFKTAFAPMPRSSKDAEIGNTSFGGEFYAIGKNSPNKEEAYKFIRYMTTEATKVGVKGLPGWKKADGKAAVESIIKGHEDSYNVDSLLNTLYDERVKTSLDTNITVSYQAQFKKVIENGFSYFMLDNVSAEDAQKKMLDDAEKIVKTSAN